MSDKKKGTKGKKGKLKKRLEEQKRREEEALLAAAKEEQERLEREREEEERLRLELKNSERREKESNELRVILEKNQNAVNKWKNAFREKAKWDRYMSCDGSPNPIVQPEINAFISLWKDAEVQIKPALQQCALALRLTDELEHLLNEETAPSVVQVYRDTSLSLQQLIYGKLQLATEEILKNSKSFLDNETNNMQMVVQDDNVTLCLWANLNKSPRFKGYSFTEVGLGFELPKQLAVSDIVVRIMHTRFDHLSHLSCHAQVQNKRTDEKAEEPEIPLVEGLTPPIDEEMKREDEFQPEPNPQPKEDDLLSINSEDKKSAVTMPSANGEILKPEEGQASETVMTFEEGTDEADYTPAVVEPMTNNADVHVVDLLQHTPLGGVYYFDLFHLPPQIHTACGWEMREILDTGLQVFMYPPEPSESAASETDESHKQSFLPAGVTVTLPDSVIFFENPQPAWWDPIGQNWQTDGITEISYNREAGSISFKMESFSAFTLLQETHANMPFQCWELRPLGQDSAMLTITTAFTEVSITVKENQCMLQMDDDPPALTGILGKWMSLCTLQKAMKNAGVNVFISEFSEKYVMVSGKVSKNSVIEHGVYQQMALIASTFAFSWSKWNAQGGQDQLILQVCEHLKEGRVPEDTWDLYLLGAQRCQRLNMTETSDSFSDELPEETDFHSTFLHMLRVTLSPEGQHRVQNAHYLFVETVHKLLCSTRVLTFS